MTGLEQPYEHLQFWGKAQPQANSEALWHPVAFHCLDVACVAERILHERASTRRSAQHLLSAQPDHLIGWLVALVALHDLGKFSRPFQAMRPDLWPRTLGPLNPSGYPSKRHTYAGWHLWQDELASQLDALFPETHLAASTVIMGSVFGHHGRPLASSRTEPSLAGTIEAGTATVCARALVDQFIQAPLVLPRLNNRAARRLSWWLAGFVSVSDWIGSNQRWFPYTSPSDLSLSEYRELAAKRATVAIREAGLRPPLPASRRSFSDLTARHAPSPVQQWADQVDLLSDPLLIIIEDVTGSGKTEAAHVIVHRLLAAGRAGGAYWAMPTQATANAMYDRQQALMRGLFETAGNELASLVLAHGQSRLHEGFRRSVLGETQPSPASTVAAGEDEEEQPAEIACPAFLADDRRAGFLADIGAGTVDQALLAVVPSKFNTVRLLGLSEKVLVVDEAHAYDAFTRVELETILKFQAALGGSAVVLSATLTANQRQRLIDAWHSGAGLVRPGEILPAIATDHAARAPYPVATVCSTRDRDATTVALAAPAHVSREVPVRLVHDSTEAMSLLKECAQGGGCAAWIRNTVNSCLDSAAALADAGVAVDVFHARFAQGDRQRREREVMQFAGSGARHDARQGRVLVATQVIEQSLDLDFDLMITDLAPIDLLIQRMGRLRRHRHRDLLRPQHIPCRLVVLSPDPDESVTSDWLDELLPSTKFVYPNPGILWRTARSLADRGRIAVPDDVRYLVETAYAADAPCPEGLMGDSARAQGKDKGHMASATYATLRVEEGYHGDQSVFLDDVRAVTRIGDEQTTIRLARIEGDRLEPWWQDASLPEWHRWALSEVRVRATRVPWNARAEPCFEGLAAVARASWGPVERDLPLLTLEADGPRYRGALHRPSDDTRSPAVIEFRYSCDRGLEFVK